MKHINKFNKLNEEISVAGNGQLLGDFLCNKLMTEYNETGGAGPRHVVYLKYYDDFNDRRKDEERRSIYAGVESQYSDFFVILKPRLNHVDMKFLEMLLDEPYSGSLYVSGSDNRMQVRISGYKVVEMYENINVTK